MALVHPFSWPEVRRGGERLLHDLGWYLAGAGHRVEVISGSWAGPSVVAGPDGTVLRRYQLRDPAWLRARHVGPMESFGLIALGALLRRRYDVVHCLTPTGVLAARLSGHRCVYTVLGHPSEEDFALQPGSARQFKAAVRAATAATALSRSAADRVQALAGRRPEVLPPGVRLDRFTPELAPRQGAPRLLFASDASEIRKGVHHALAALGHVLARRPDARLVLAGPGRPDWAAEGVGASASALLARVDPLAVRGLGAEWPALRAATEAHEGVPPDQMPAEYRAATVTVLPSWEEAFGLVLAESLACGTPVACFSEAGMLEVVDRPEVGRTAPFGDDAGLGRAVLEAIDLAARPGTPGICAGHARRWGWVESVGPAYEELYRQVVIRGRATVGAGGPNRMLRP